MQDAKGVMLKAKAICLSSHSKQEADERILNSFPDGAWVLEVTKDMQCYWKLVDA